MRCEIVVYHMLSRVVTKMAGNADEYNTEYDQQDTIRLHSVGFFAKNHFEIRDIALGALDCPAGGYFLRRNNVRSTITYYGLADICLKKCLKKCQCLSIGIILL
jgi:hypothetical protein